MKASFILKKFFTLTFLLTSPLILCDYAENIPEDGEICEEENLVRFYNNSFFYEGNDSFGGTTVYLKFKKVKEKNIPDADYVLGQRANYVLDQADGVSFCTDYPIVKITSSLHGNSDSSSSSFWNNLFGSGGTTVEIELKDYSIYTIGTNGLSSSKKIPIFEIETRFITGAEVEAREAFTDSKSVKL